MKFKSRKTLIILLAVLILVIASLSGGLIARYLTEENGSASMHSGKFELHSDLLQKSGGSHEVTDWNTVGITFTVYNYAPLNPSLVSERDITYAITLPTGYTASVKDALGNTVPLSDGVYTITSSAATYHTITLTAPVTAEENDVVSVVLTSKTPYTTTLSADFTLKGKSTPEYKIEDNGTHVLVTLYTNNYAGAVTFTWSEKFSPDNTNPVMASWLDASGTANVDLPANTTYELIFYKNALVTLNRALTADTTVTVE